MTLLDAAMPGGIERSEAEGQRQLNDGEIDSLPSECRFDDVLRSWGFELGEPDPEDPLFRPAKLPPGWTMKATDHDMWSMITDDQGRERVRVFYKAAFYDRKAHLSVNSRLETNGGRFLTSTESYELIVTDKETGETMEFGGPFQETGDAVREFMRGVFGDPDYGHPKHWGQPAPGWEV